MLKKRKEINKITDKQIEKNRLKQIDKEKMWDMFLGIWKKRKHISEVSGKYLGNEPLTVFFHHILDKENYEEAKFDEENIILLTWEEHDKAEMDSSFYPEINSRMEKLKEKYGKCTQKRILG